MKQEREWWRKLLRRLSRIDRAAIALWIDARLRAKVKPRRLPAPMRLWRSMSFGAPLIIGEGD